MTETNWGLERVKRECARPWTDAAATRAAGLVARLAEAVETANGVARELVNLLPTGTGLEEAKEIASLLREIGDDARPDHCSGAICGLLEAIAEGEKDDLSALSPKDQETAEWEAESAKRGGA